MIVCVRAGFRANQQAIIQILIRYINVMLVCAAGAQGAGEIGKRPENVGRLEGGEPRKPPKWKLWWHSRGA